MNTKDIKHTLQDIKNNKPLILNITNEVTIYDVASIERLIGASPIMTNNYNEFKKMSHKVQAIVINLGTLSKEHIKLTKKILRQSLFNTPIILDIVGYGSNDIRVKTYNKVLPLATIIKGNYGEIYSLYFQKSHIKGIDSDIVGNHEQNLKIVKELSIRYNKIIIMTGPIDYVSDSIATYVIKYGRKYMSEIVGTGCILNGVIACFIGQKDWNILDIVKSIVFFTITGDNHYLKKINSVIDYKQNWFKNMEIFHELKDTGIDFEKQ